MKLGNIAAGLAAAGIFIASGALAADIPKSTASYLKELKLKGDVLSGLDQDLAVPQEWVEGARKEGKVRILGSWDRKQFDILTAPFKERYPAIEVEYNEATSFHARAIAPLIAYKEKHYITDVFTGFGGSARHYMEIKALENLKKLPSFKSQVKGANHPSGDWAAMRLRFWCIAYNTNFLKKADLPKTWEDLITNKALHNGNLGVGNRPQLWVLMLRNAWGKEKTDKYVEQFFNVVKPQLRKEGMSALLGLVAAGEFHAVIPAAAYNVKVFREKGAPLAWHCPQPVPLAPSQIGILSGNPHPNAARLWTNWMLSKEGQIAQFFADNAPPSHAGLQTRDFMVFPDEVMGRETAVADDDQQDEVSKIWKAHWEAAGR